ncbi:MAG: ChbG/HpnK family deacetylase [Lachnospiraceae bacterium]|nr:ChbG/HpnK family deacetylase [Lachnospiraceae bacterium]
MALIVNADDFGMNKSVNAAIADAFELHLIDRTTMMVNMPSAADAMELAEDKGFAGSVGLHLNLTSGKPLTEDIAADPLICGPSGEFSADFARSMKTRFFLPSGTSKRIEKEIRAQLDEYRRLGGTLWHIDSHHHVHTDPSIWRILKKVLPDYPVVSIRLGRNMYIGGNVLFRLYKSLYNLSVKRRSRIRQDYFGSAEDYASFIAHKPDAVRSAIEVMVHPVYDDSGKLSDKCSGTYKELARLH